MQAWNDPQCKHGGRFKASMEDAANVAWRLAPCLHGLLPIFVLTRSQPLRIVGNQRIVSLHQQLKSARRTSCKAFTTALSAIP
jgi:hypothetical protein